MTDCAAPRHGQDEPALRVFSYGGGMNLADPRCTCTWGHCCGRCHNRATEQDGRCDLCSGTAAQIEHGLHYIRSHYGNPRST